MSGLVRFTKMSGAGNDFVVLDGEAWASLSGDRAAFVRAVCRRGLSVGADGLLVVDAGDHGRVRVDFFNPDGGVAFCGNGSRCAARFALLRKIAPGRSMVLATSVGDVPAEIDGGVVSLTLPPPEDGGTVSLSIDEGTFHGRRVTAGVPHLVIPVSGLASFDLPSVGPPLRRHPALGPAGANVDLVENDREGRVHVRTFERGVENETLSCGTGAVAAAFAARLSGSAEMVVVVPRSGRTLRVSIQGDPNRPTHARLTGDARVVFEGVLDSEGIEGDS